MIRPTAILLFSAAMGLAQLEPPRLGCFLDQAGLLHSVYGVRANFILGPALESGVLSAACSERFAVVKTEQALELLDLDAGLSRRWAAPGGPALFGLSQDSVPALVYFPRTSDWFRLAQGELLPLAFDFATPHVSVLAIAQPDANRMAAVVERDARLWLLKVRLADGQLEEETELAGVSAPLLLRPDGAILFVSGVMPQSRAPWDKLQLVSGGIRKASGQAESLSYPAAQAIAPETEALPSGLGLVLRTSNGAERRTPLPAHPVALDPMGSRWVHLGLAEPGGHLALLILEDREELYRLPEAPR